jgi:hypothetical protein
MSRRAAARLAWSLWVLSLTLVSLGLLLLILNWSRAGTHLLEYWPEDYWPEEMFVGVAFSTVGAVIASRHHEHPIGWIFCAIGLVAGVDYLSAQYATYLLLAQPASLPGRDVLAWVNSWVLVPHIGLYMFLALLFPDGRLPSARWRAVAWVFAVVVVGGTAMVALSPGPLSGFEPIGNPFGVEGLPNLTALVEALVYTLTLVAVVSLFARLRRSRGVQRQQVKWFAYAASILATCATLTYVVSEATGAGWVRWVSFVPAMVGFVGMPIAVGIAVLRYHLYNIDLLINRTLVYGTLTVTLALVYFGGVTATQAIFRTLTGQGSTFAIVVSTLVIAALFNPLRRRIQSFIDRRFYRRKYDARKTLEAFSAQLRNETDLDALSDDLVGVVRETMQPAHVSLWLRPETAPKGKQAE